MAGFRLMAFKDHRLSSISWKTKHDLAVRSEYDELVDALVVRYLTHVHRLGE